MKFSIITVAKNNKDGLLRAIECVRNQTYKNIEHIIVDGGSTDGSAAAIKNEQLKIKNLFFLSEADSGIYDAINKGIKLATGDVIGLLHSDDLFADEKVIEKYAEVFAGDSFVSTEVPPQNDSEKVDAVYSDLVYVRKKQEVRSEKLEDGDKNTTDYQLPTTNYPPPSTNYTTIRYWRSGDPSTPLRMIEWLKKGWMPPHPTLFIRKEIFEKYGSYDTSFKIAADYEMILRLLYKYKITTHYLPITTYLMSIGGASNKSINNILLKSREDLFALKLHDLPRPLITLLSKNFRKLPQFLARDLS